MTPNNNTFEFNLVARLAAPDDNVAVATGELPAGAFIDDGQRILELTQTILVGHRFAVQPIHNGEFLRSWGEPFGTAVRDIAPGEYVCNAAVLRELSRRSLTITLPSEPNFVDDIPPFEFDESSFIPGNPVPRYDGDLTFMGYPRAGKRGTGTRNFIILLGTTSLTAGFVTALEARLQHAAKAYLNIDGIVAVAHTEGGHQNPNNRDLLLRTLAGFMVHPNVGAVLAVDYGHEALTIAALRDYMTAHDYPLEDVPHHFQTLTGSFQDNLDAATQTVQGWLEPVNAAARVPTSLSELKIALQCGGSDAFSGISGNPLAGWVAKEIIAYGGSANLAETDELVGAERYMLKNMKDLETAKRFLATLDRFKTWAGWHGHSVFGNPSGGNLLRGLYNIYLKSLGAAAKRNPDVRVEQVINYGEPMREPGFYFMDSPGNDLESVAGQVASGCNMIFFITGNGSITNFPFVPTIKIMTTTRRFELLSNEMDVNAGVYLEGVPMEVPGAATFDLTLAAASGQATAGERAGHAQVQIWRDWRLTAPKTNELREAPATNGKPLPVHAVDDVPEYAIPFYRTESGMASDQVALIMPTSLCAGQIARMTTDRLNQTFTPDTMKGIRRFVALVHTEGCGASISSEYIDTAIGYLQHPFIKHCLLMEHGCEITHNGYFRNSMLDAGLEPSQFGWASIQLDGGIEAVQKKVTDWFAGQLAAAEAPEMVTVGLEAVRLGILSVGNMSDDAAQAFADVTRAIVTAGGTVVLSENDALLQSAAFTRDVVQGEVKTTLKYAEPFRQKGLHIMQRVSDDRGETLTGLGAAGVEVILAYVTDYSLPGHPLVPTLYVTAGTDESRTLDLALNGNRTAWRAQLLDLLVSVLSREYVPGSSRFGNVHFQITRGLLGVSL